MRWLFLLVLSLNIAYVAWQMSLPATDSYAKVPPLKNVPTIVLLSEVQVKQVEQMAQSSEKSESEASASLVAVGGHHADEQGGADQSGVEAVAAEEVSEKAAVVEPENET